MTATQLQLEKLPPLLTVREAARIMGVSVDTAGRWAREGKIKRVGNRKGSRYVTRSILEWIEREAT